MHDGYLWLEKPIPITDILIHRITRLPHSRQNLAKEFGGKVGERDIIERMKEKFKLVKKLHGYSISSITYLVIKVATKILAKKIMWKCCADEVPTPVVSLAAQCAEGVQFNCACYLCSEFLANYREA